MSWRNPRWNPRRPLTGHRQCKGRNNFPELRHINRLSYDYLQNIPSPHTPPCCPCLFRNGGSNVSRLEEYVFGRHKPWKTVFRRHIPPDKRQDRITNERGGEKRGIADNHRLSLIREENSHSLLALRAKHPPRPTPARCAKGMSWWQVWSNWLHPPRPPASRAYGDPTAEEGVLQETAIQAKSLFLGACRKGGDTGSRDSGYRERRLRCAEIWVSVGIMASRLHGTREVLVRQLGGLVVTRASRPHGTRIQGCRKQGHWNHEH